MKNKCRKFILPFLMALVCYVTVIADVTPLGQFQSGIPIQLPAGAGGMQPNAGLQYNSDSGSGIAGVGWNTGLPAIRRINYGRGVRYDGNDTYAGLEGRLVDVSGNGSFYHPADETWTRYVPYGRQGDAPGYWIAYANGGTRFLYGTTPDSQVRKVDPETGTETANVRTWALAAVIDVHGNYYEVAYEVSSGACYPKKITYTKHGIFNETFPFITDDGLINKFYTVNYVYEARDDVRVSYDGGKIIRDRRLVEIIIKCDSLLVRKYVFEYQYSSITKRSLLKRVHHFGSDGISELPPMTFEYTEGAQTYRSNAEYADDQKLPLLDICTFQGAGHRMDSNEGRKFLDLNGDGLVDILWNDIGIGNGCFRLNTGNGWETEEDSDATFDESVPWIYRSIITPDRSQDEDIWRGGPNTVDMGTRFADLNGDGLVDIIHGRNNFGNHVESAQLNNGSGFENAPEWKLPIDPSLPLETRKYEPGSAALSGNARLVKRNYGQDYIENRINSAITYTVYSDITKTCSMRYLYGVTTNIPARIIINGTVHDVTLTKTSWALKEGTLTDIDLVTGSNTITFQALSQGYTLGSIWVDGCSGTPVTFVDETCWALPPERINSANGVDLIDVNGDGLSDLVYAKLRVKYDSNGNYKGNEEVAYTWLNKGKGNGFERSAWELAGQWKLPVLMLKDRYQTIYPDSTNIGLGVQFTDLNGDGLVDVVKSYNNQHASYLNNGNGWTRDANYDLPLPPGLSMENAIHEPWRDQIDNNAPARKNTTNGILLIDVNGDGLVDIVWGQMAADSWYNWSDDWCAEITGLKKDVGHTSKRKTWLNTGSGWIEDAGYQLPPGMELTIDAFDIYWMPADDKVNKHEYTSDLGIRFYDMNNDGLVDIIKERRNDNGYQPNSDAYRNTGTGWVRDSTLKPPNNLAFAYQRYQKANVEQNMDKPASGTTGVYVMDINGDGLKDYIRSYKDENRTVHKEVWLHEGEYPDLLKAIHNGSGGLQIMEYTPLNKMPDVKSTDLQQVDGTAPALSGRYVVSRINNMDFQGTASKAHYSTSYRYHDPGRMIARYTPLDHTNSNNYNHACPPPLKAYLGFQSIKQINDRTGIVSRTWFSRQWPFQGRPVRTETRTGNGALLTRKIINEYYMKSCTEAGVSNIPYVVGFDESGTWLRSDLQYAALIFSDNSEEETYDSGHFISKKTSSVITRGAYGNVTQCINYVKDSQNTVLEKLETLAGFIQPALDPVNGILLNPRFIGVLYQTESYINNNRISRERRYFDSLPLKSIGARGLVAKMETYVGDCAANGDWLAVECIYDKVGNTVSQTCNGLTAQTFYDNAYHKFPYMSIDALGQTTTMIYDARYDAEIINTNPDKLRTEIQLDVFGRSIMTTQYDGSTLVRKSKTSYSLERTQGGENVIREETYFGDLINETNFLWKELYTDGQGRKIKSRTEGYKGEDILAITEYDTAGRPYRVSSPSGSWTTTKYDECGRTLRIDNANGSVVEYEYFNESISLPPGAVRSKTTTCWESASVWKKDRIFYDHANREVKVVNGITAETPDGVSMEYQYDTKGNIIKITSPAAGNTTQTTAITYDSLGRKTAVDDPNAGKTTYSYNTILGQASFGIYEQITKPAPGEAQNQTETIRENYNYDAYGRLMTTRIYDENNVNTKSVSQTFETNTNRMAASTVTEAGYTVKNSFTYDIFGNPVTVNYSITDPDQYVQSTSISCEYDNLGRKVKMWYPDVANPMGPAKVYESRYDNHGFLEQILFDNEVYATYDEYNAYGQVGHTAYRNEVEHFFTYDTCGRLTNSKAAKGSTNYLDYSYNYYDSNLLKSITDNLNTARSYAYAYDNLNRLVSAIKNPAGSARPLTYAYDTAGNLVYKSELDASNFVNGKTLAYTPGTHQLAYDGANRYIWSEGGNMMSKGSTDYEYTDQNMLSRVIKNGTLTAEYFYGFSTERVVKVFYKDADTRIRTYYMAGGLYEIRELWEDGQKTGTQRTLYLNGPGGQKIASITASEGSFDANPVNPGEGLARGTCFYSNNYLNSAALITDASGNKRTFYQYQPYGQLDAYHTEHFGPQATAYTYTGQEYDNESEFFYCNSRYYDPSTGIFTSADTIIPGSKMVLAYNRYMYCFGNPINLTDPNGHTPTGDLINMINSDNDPGNDLPEDISEWHDREWNIFKACQTKWEPDAWSQYVSYMEQQNGSITGDEWCMFFLSFEIYTGTYDWNNIVSIMANEFHIEVPRLLEVRLEAAEEFYKSITRCARTGNVGFLGLLDNISLDKFGRVAGALADEEKAEIYGSILTALAMGQLPVNFNGTPELSARNEIAGDIVIHHDDTIGMSLEIGSNACKALSFLFGNVGVSGVGEATEKLFLRCAGTLQVMGAALQIGSVWFKAGQRLATEEDVARQAGIVAGATVDTFLIVVGMTVPGMGIPVGIYLFACNTTGVNPAEEFVTAYTDFALDMNRPTNPRSQEGMEQYYMNQLLGPFYQLVRR